MTRLVRRLPLLFCAAAAVANATSQQPTTGPGEVRYGRDVRPILADRCFRCHGPDPNTREADLRLDVRADALAARDDEAAIVPGDPARSLLWQRITTSDDDDVMPPKKSGKPALTADERAVVERWIRAGANYEEHWSFVPPTRPAVPQQGAAWAKNPIDHFVFAALAQHGLPPSQPADAETLARRVFLVLTGLPPTPAELDAFLADRSPDAYERLVDRLLTEEPYRTRLAEHLAQPWLDAARYADTSGIHMDAGRQIWPWRDWLIDALRSDLPFDRFVVEQLAGDLLPGATLAQRTATGFLRNHVTTDEGGAIDEEYRIEYAAERTNTVGSVFLGLTLGCVRCHDHKYDPIRQEDYYRLFAFFNQNQEPGLYSQSPDSNRALEPFLAVPSAAQVAAREALQRELEQAEQALGHVPPDEDARRAEFFAALAAQGGPAWRPATVRDATSAAGATLTPQPDGSVLASGENPARDRHTITLAVPAGDLRLLCVEALPDPSLPGGKVGRAPNGNAVLSHASVRARPLGSDAAFVEVPLAWAYADFEQTDGDYGVTNVLAPDPQGWAVGAHQRPAQPVRALLLAEAPFGLAGPTEVQVELRYESIYAQHTFGRVRIHLGSLGAALLPRLPIASSGFHVAGPFPAAGPAELYATAFGPETVKQLQPGQSWGNVGWRFDPALRPGVVATNLPAGRNATYVGQRLHAPDARQLRLSLGSDDGFQLYVGGQKVAERQVDRGAAADQDAAAVAVQGGATLLVLKVVNTGGQGGCYLRIETGQDELAGDLPLWLLPPATWDDALQARLGTAWRERFSPDFLARRDRVAALQKQLAELDAATPRTMVMQEAATYRPTFVLVRGEYDKPDRSRPVERDLPAMFGALPADQPKDRLALARWLVSEQNPLLLRVAQNRLWEFVFGTGLVRTSEDFGHQGEWPSHPELLDWLATEFRARGHSTHAMLRLLVTSATFRQQSQAPPASRAKDPQDRLLGWFPRRRLTAEAIRDQALFAGGLLVERTGGPSVKPYQPPGLWQEVAMLQSNTRIYEPGQGDALWRRSLYTYWKRACPPPTLLVLDAPTREFCTIRRSSTNTPLQALALWNDEQFVEAARALAQRTLQQPGDDRQRLSAMHRRCTGHPLDDDRAALAQDLLGRLRQRYEQAPADADKLLAVGQAPRDAALPAPELAAWTLVANAFLNLDATLCLD